MRFKKIRKHLFSRIYRHEFTVQSLQYHVKNGTLSGDTNGDISSPTTFTYLK